MSDDIERLSEFVEEINSLPLPTEMVRHEFSLGEGELRLTVGDRVLATPLRSLEGIGGGSTVLLKRAGSISDKDVLTTDEMMAEMLRTDSNDLVLSVTREELEAVKETRAYREWAGEYFGHLELTGALGMRVELREPK